MARKPSDALDRPAVVTNVQLTPASAEQVATGLVGFLRFRVNAVLHVEATLRRSARGRLYVAYIHRDDRRGQRHFPVRPADEATRQELERQVFEQIWEQLPPAMEGRR